MEQTIATVMQEREVLKHRALNRVHTTLKLLVEMCQNRPQDDNFALLVRDALSHTLLAKHGTVNEGQRDTVLRLLLRERAVSHLELAMSTTSQVEALVHENLYLLEA